MVGEPLWAISKLTLLQHIIASAPPKIEGALRQLLMVIEAPDSLEGLSRVAQNLQTYEHNFEIMDALSLGMLPAPATTVDLLRWILSHTSITALPSNGGTEPSPPRGTITSNPIFAVLWMELGPKQMRVAEARLQVLVAHANLPFDRAEKPHFRSAREKAARAIRIFATQSGEELASFLPKHGTRHPAEYAQALEGMKETAPNASTRADLCSIQYLIQIAAHHSDVRRRAPGGHRRTAGTRVKRGATSPQIIEYVQSYIEEDAGVPVIIASYRPSDAIVADLEDAGSVASEYLPRSENFQVTFNDAPSAYRSASQNKLRVKAVASGVARANQKLVQKIGNLSPLELDALVEQFERACEAANLPSRKLLAVLLVACSLATGRSFAFLAGQVVPNKSSNASVYIKSCAAGRPYFELPALSLQGAQDLTVFGREQSLPAGSLVRLPCPSLIVRLLERVAVEKPTMPEDTSRDGLVADARQYLSAVAKTGSFRLTESKIENWLFSRILGLSDGGIAAAALITATQDPVATNPAQYLTLSQAEVTDLYLRAVERMNCVSAPTVGDSVQFYDGPWYIGSRYSPNQDFLRAFIEQLKSQIKSFNHKTHNVAYIHNLMVLYTVLMSSFLCCFRAVREPILRPLEIDQCTGFAGLQDKDSQDGYNARLIWVPEVMRRHLNHYADHVAAVEHYLRQNHPGGGGSMARLFFLDAQGGTQEATVALLTREFAVAGWHLPLNAGRHYVKTQLRCACAHETLLAYLGHWRRGTEPWASASSLDPQAYQADLAPALTRLLEADGWEALTGLPS
jgi:hypothetical protein